LKIAAIETTVKVDANTPLSTDTNNNANQQVISGKDLDALPDDPDELAAALQALAGPSMGPNGGQIFVDGFSGSLPPKEAIREIRINQNPFSPENDQPSARIDILTRPGTDKFRGSASFNFTDESLNTRNPFSINSSKRAPYQVRQLNGSISGPIVKKKASFFLEMNHNQQDDNAEILATVLGQEATTGTDSGRAVPNPLTFARITTDDRNEKIKTYVGEGCITDDPLDTFGSRAVVEIKDLQRLMRYVCKQGYEHHAAMNASHVAGILAEAFETYLGWEVYVHEG
jgi:hypothetical protein